MDKYRTFLPHIAREWRWLCGIAALTGVSCAAAALQPWPMKLAVDSAFGGRPLPPAIASAFAWADVSAAPLAVVAACAFAIMAVAALNSALTTALTWAWSVAGQRMVANVATALFARLQRASFSYHQTRGVGDSLARLTGDAWCVYTLAGQAVGPVQQALTLATVGVVAWTLNPKLAMLSISAAPLLGLCSLCFGRRLKASAKGSRQAQTQLLSFVHQTLSAIPIVQAFGAEERNTRSFHVLAAAAVAVSQRTALISSVYGLANGFISSTAAALVLYIGGREVIAGRLTIGGMLVFVAYLRTLQGAAEGLLKAYGALKPIEASMERVQEALSTHHSDVPEAASPVTLRGGGALAVRFENVTFGHAGGRPVLRNVSFEAAPGEFVGIVGSTGAGKSTLASLIPRFADAWEGVVRVGGVDVRNLRLEELRRAVAVLWQEPYLFPWTVGQNIRYGRLDASDTEIRDAARTAEAEPFIAKLPEQYETVLGAQGNTLSGGERQRLAIARSIVKQARVLILDEPTSALDAHAESRLIEALFDLRRERTILVIAHRLSTVRRADRILVMDGGRVVESGSHTELLAADGAYARLCAAQRGAAVGAA